MCCCSVVSSSDGRRICFSCRDCSSDSFVLNLDKSSKIFIIIVLGATFFLGISYVQRPFINKILCLTIEFVSNVIRFFFMERAV